jgi:hypothetical protein
MAGEDVVNDGEKASEEEEDVAVVVKYRQSLTNALDGDDGVVVMLARRAEMDAKMKIDSGYCFVKNLLLRTSQCCLCF